MIRGIEAGQICMCIQFVCGSWHIKMHVPSLKKMNVRIYGYRIIIPERLSISTLQAFVAYIYLYVVH